MGFLHTRLLSWLGILLPALLLSGDRPPVDPRFVTPAATVRTFWRSVETGSPEKALDCFVGVGVQQLGTRLLRLPPLAALEVRDVRVETAGTERALVRYQVRYRFRAADHGGSFRTADELLRVGGEWRIVRPLSPGATARPKRTGAPPILARRLELRGVSCAVPGVDRGRGAC